jgi:hypothetical protein
MAHERHLPFVFTKRSTRPKSLSCSFDVTAVMCSGEQIQVVVAGPASSARL